MYNGEVLTNVNGLLLDDGGTIRGLDVPIRDEPKTGLKRTARHEGFEIGPDMQMIQRIRVVTLDEGGGPLRDSFVQVSTGMQLNQLQNRYADMIYVANTAGAYVNAITGAACAEQDENAVEQLRFFQGISLGMLKAMGVTVTDATAVATLIYVLLLNEIRNLDAQGRL